MTEYTSLPETIVTIVLVFLAATILIVVTPLIFPDMIRDNVEKHIVLLRTDNNTYENSRIP